MYILDLFTVTGYLHTAGFENRRGINFAKCIYDPVQRRTLINIISYTPFVHAIRGNINEHFSYCMTTNGG